MIAPSTLVVCTDFKAGTNLLAGTNFKAGIIFEAGTNFEDGTTTFIETVNRWRY